MPLPVFVGDEVSASGYRLAGLRVRVATPEQALSVLTAESRDAPLLLLGAALAQQLPATQLEALLARVDPPLVVVPDLRGGAQPADLALRLRRQLGVLE